MASVWLWGQKDSNSLSCAGKCLRDSSDSDRSGGLGGREAWDCILLPCSTQTPPCIFKVLMFIGLNAQVFPFLYPKGSDLCLSNVIWGERASSSLLGPGSWQLYSSDNLTSATPPQSLHHTHFISRGHVQTSFIASSIRMETLRTAAKIWPRDKKKFVLPFHERCH